MLVFAIAVLAHCPQFTDPENRDQLLTMKSCLWFIMEPLITKNDSYCYSFYKGMLDRLKTVKDALEPDSEITNQVNNRQCFFPFDFYDSYYNCLYSLQKIYTLCDLAMTILLAKTVNFEMKDVLTEIKISALFFKKIDDPLFVNDKCYLPTDLQYHVSLFAFNDSKIFIQWVVQNYIFTNNVDSESGSLIKKHHGPATLGNFCCVQEKIPITSMLCSTYN